MPNEIERKASKESEKYPADRESAESDLAAFQASGMAVVIIVILVLGLGVVAFVPLSPTIIGFVQVSTAPDDRPAIALTSLTYEKLPIGTAIINPRDSIQILQVGATTTGFVQPTYRLTITVSYGGQVVLSGESGVSNGFYQFSGYFLPRPEQVDIPYQVEITIWQGSYTVTIYANLLPV